MTKLKHDLKNLFSISSLCFNFIKTKQNDKIEIDNDIIEYYTELYQIVSE